MAVRVPVWRTWMLAVELPVFAVPVPEPLLVQYANATPAPAATMAVAAVPTTSFLLILRMVDFPPLEVMVCVRTRPRDRFPPPPESGPHKPYEAFGIRLAGEGPALIGERQGQLT